ncbi:MAG: YceI family protein [Candidatus Omnitrophota bacterium]|nr:YceI family protein [Candidatus Omnitrophota bacterium]
MRRISLIRSAGGLLVALLAVGASTEATAAERFDADPASSRVTVEGTSTLHHWKVEGRRVEGYLSIDEPGLASLWRPSDSSLQALSPTVRVEIPVTSLVSGKRGMDEKMQEALKATTHPLITYHLQSAKVITRQAAQADDTILAIETTGVLTVAGAERAVDLPMHVRRLSENRLEVSGEASLRMTEFGIVPPRAMLGTIRTGDEVRVHWTWGLVRHRIDEREDR